jgi:hypothetical protein
VRAPAAGMRPRRAARWSRRCGCIALLALLPLPAAETPVAAEERPWSCGEISACMDRNAERCPGGAKKIPCLYACRKLCRRQGCDGAKARFDALTTCVVGWCGIPCGKGPTPKCRACTEKHCSGPVDRCHQQRCP